MQTFSPFRVVGSVCADVPGSLTLLYNEPIIMVAIGRTFQLFRGKGLTMLRGGPTFEDRVACVSQCGRHRFVGEGSRIHAFSHHKPLWTHQHNTVLGSHVALLVAKDDFLFSYGEDKRVVVWHIQTGAQRQEFLLEDNAQATTLLLPVGYTNKLLVSTSEGALQLYNFVTGKCLWKATLEPSQQILCLTASAYKDIVAYGTSGGRVVVFNFGSGSEIASFRHEDCAVTSVVFRQDKDGFLVSGTSLGEVAVWDLHEKMLDGVLTRSKQVRSRGEANENVHTSTVHTLLPIPNESAVVSLGEDNAMMQFRFDTVDGLGLLLRERRGHMGACTVACFYNSDLLVTAGEDRAVRMTHIFSDRASWELSQGKLGRRGRETMMSRELLKLTPAIALVTCPSRNYQWSSIVSLHQSSAQMCGWRPDKRALECKLSGISTFLHTARCIRLTACGNFAVVGYSSGNLAAIHLQNRSVCQFFAPNLKSAAHEGPVECIEVACANRIVVSGGADGNIKLWDLISRKLRLVIPTGHAMNTSCLHSTSSLFVVAQHFTLRVYHCNPDAGLTNLATPVRVFEGHNATISSVALEPFTNRYVVSASMDGAVVVWDLSAAACVGQYRVPTPMLSMAFHPDALFMISCQAGERGAFLWTNNLRYGFVPEVVADPKAVAVETLPLLHYPISHAEATDDIDVEGVEAARLQEPEAHGEGLQDVELFDASKDIELQRREQEKLQQAQLDAIPVTGMQMSGVPRSIWFTLPILDQIKEKNQPLLPPKKRGMPFFLPTTNELRPTFIVTASDSNSQLQSVPHAEIGGDVNAPLPMHRLIRMGKFDDALELLQTYSASTIDLEIRDVINYVEDAEYTAQEIAFLKTSVKALLSFIAYGLSKRVSTDLLQGILANLLRAHGVFFCKLGPEVVPQLEEVAYHQNQIRYELDHLVGYPNCMVSMFTGSMF